MSNNKSDNEIVIIIGIVFLALAAWVSKTFGLNLMSALKVVLAHIVFMGLMAGVIYLVKQDFVRWTLMLPISVVAYLACWIPAIDYWASQDIGEVAYIVNSDSVWYATGWIQTLIALSILVIGHGLIYYFDSDRDR